MDKDDFLLWQIDQMSDDELAMIDRLEADLQEQLDHPIALVGIDDLPF